MFRQNIHLKNILTILLILTGNLSAQQELTHSYMVVRSAPDFMLSISCNLHSSALELGGVYNSDFHSGLVKNGESFGTRNGLGAAITSRINLLKSSKLWSAQSISYNNLRSYLFSTGFDKSDNGSASYNCFTGSVGLEYCILPVYSVKIFTGAEINASFISGRLEIWNPSDNDPYNTDVYEINASFRMGYGFTAGTIFMINDKIGVNLSAKYSYLNAFFRSSGGSSADKEFTLRDGVIHNGLLFAGKKRFTYFTLGAGITFYFGIKEKYYKLN